MDNVSAVRSFTLLGINETLNYKIAIFCVTLLYYSVILFFNIALIVIIALDENLHEPMYILLASFCINGLYGSTGFYPKFMFDLLLSYSEISYEGCLLQAYVMYSFACCDLSILAVMAYDRYLAICRPLHYHSFMTKRRISQLVCFSWLVPLFVFSFNIVLTSTKKLCGSKLQKLYCVNWMLVQLACSDSDTLSNSIVSYTTIFIYVLHGFFIIWTYMHLIKTCVRSKEDRLKFTQTCVPHLIALLTFMFVMLFELMYMRFGSSALPSNLQNFVSLIFLLIPPVMNPLIYGFKLTKIRHRILGLIYVQRK